MRISTGHPSPPRIGPSYINKIKASGADVIYIALISAVILVFAKQAYDFGIQKYARIVSVAAPGPVELEAGGKACVGIFGTSDWCWDVNTPKSDKWEGEFWERFNTIPSDAACQSYVGAMNLFNAIEKAGSFDPQKIATALRGITFDGPYGVVRISAKDNCMRNDAVLTETTHASRNLYGAKIFMKVIKYGKFERTGSS
jgi:branched-chain amino acid transport system substrate-binding protein